MKKLLIHKYIEEETSENMNEEESTIYTNNSGVNNDDQNVNPGDGESDVEDNEEEQIKGEDFLPILEDLNAGNSDEIYDKII